MRKIILFIAQSLDGYIASPDGSVDFLNDPAPSAAAGDYGYRAFLDSIDITLMGHKTYQEILGFGIPFPYPDKTNYIFSRKHKHEDENPVMFIDSNIVEFCKKLKSQAGKDIWLIGGGEINNILLNADLVDEIIVSIKPTVLGQGIPMFSAGTYQKKFILTKVESFDLSIVQLHLKRI